MKKIKWDGLWTATTLVEFADTALRKGFPRCVGIKMKAGFRIVRGIYSESKKPKELEETLIMTGRTVKHGEVEIRIILVLQWPKQTPRHILVSRKAKKVSFRIA
jgi:hypothetical protein